MKLVLLPMLGLFAMMGMATPSTNTYAGVTNDWYNANFTNVYELAQQRKASNSDDIVSAYLMLDWNVCFGSLREVSNSVNQVIELSDRLTNVLFRAKYDLLRQDYIAYRDQYLPTVDETARILERHKSYLRGKEMPSLYMLNLLNEAGLW